MTNIQRLKNCTNRKHLARLLSTEPSTLSYLLYFELDSVKYYSFNIAKKNGGKRVINAPSDKLKLIQKKLSDLLLDCIDEINQVRKITNTLSHGFERNKTIITNAEMHKNSRNVLNIDLENFFDSFNFGRVRGFFLKNKNFELHEEVATTIAQIACFNNKLPQGSPCSPVITNLITHSLDIGLAKLAKRYSCTYSRYADDITFSTRKKVFPPEIMKEDDGYLTGKRLRREIVRAGFSINLKKTRIQYRDSRQDVTGLIVNKKVGVKKEYRRLTKSMCNSLFQTGSFTIEVNGEHVDGTIKSLEGRLNFIDSVDHYNRIKYPQKLSQNYKHNVKKTLRINALSSREKLLKKFLFYKWFYGNSKTTILCEGKTDNIYFSSALKKIGKQFPQLCDATSQSLLQFMNYSGRTKFLLDLAGGTPVLREFIADYLKHYAAYKAPKPSLPVVMIFDNDNGLDNGNIIAALQNLKDAKGKRHEVTIFPTPKNNNFKDNVKNAEFIHVGANLYVVCTPLNAGNDTMVEDLFEKKLWGEKIRMRTFNPDDKADSKKFYGKNDFATKVVRPNKDTINFDGFKPTFNRVSKAIIHYSQLP